MVIDYISIALTLCSLVLIIAAAGLWAGAGVDDRPKYRDEQTLVGGTIWSQLIIPMGLLLSEIVDEKLDRFIHAYFLITGVGLCITTGMVLNLLDPDFWPAGIVYCRYREAVPTKNPLKIIGEIKAMRRSLSRIETELNINIFKCDQMYLGIGVLSLLAGVLTFAQFLILIYV